MEGGGMKGFRGRRRLTAGWVRMYDGDVVML